MTQIPETAILDGDMLCYKAACAAESQGMSLDELKDRLMFDVDYWTPQDCTRRLVAFSCRTKDNYRTQFWPQYKANRANKPRPKYLNVAKELVSHRFTVVERDHLEADDLIGIGMSSGLMVGVSGDKDMRTIPGWLWNPDKMCFPELISQDEADTMFYTQWLMGDSTDNIPGIPKVGPKKAEKLLEGQSVENMAAICLKAYEDKGLDREYTLAQARLVRILRDGEYDKETGTPLLWEPSLIQASKRETKL